MPPAVAAQGLSTVPSKSIIVSDNPGHATARSPAEIEIEGRNAADRPSKTGGDQIKVKFSAPANTTVATVTELPEGRYKVEYMAPIAGNYQLSITMNGEHIAGSPFKLSVTPPKAQAVHSRITFIERRLLSKTSYSWPIPQSAPATRQ